MSGVGPQDLENLAEEFLAACVESLDTIPTFEPDLDGAPDRSFVSPGLPVWDCCEQLTVYVTQVVEEATSPLGLSSGRRASFGRRDLVMLIAGITRCIPTSGGDPPEPSALQASATQINADGWALWSHLHNMVRSEELFTLCGEVFWDGLRAVTPLGGCAGWNLQVRVALDGYED